MSKTTPLAPAAVSSLADRENLLNAEREGWTLEEFLAELPLLDSDREHLKQLIEIEARHDALEMSAQFVRLVASRLRAQSPAGAALVAALGLSNGETLREMAACFRCSKQAVQNSMATIRASLPAHIVPRKPHSVVRPSERGRWLTTGEACAEIGRSPDYLRKLGVRHVFVGRQGFFEHGDLVRKENLQKIRLARREVEVAAKKYDQDRRNKL